MSSKRIRSVLVVRLAFRLMYSGKSYSSTALTRGAVTPTFAYEGELCCGDLLGYLITRRVLGGAIRAARYAIPM